MDTIPNQLPRIQSLNATWSEAVSIDMLRLDEVHPVVSGNKWYKLKENIKAAISNGRTGLLTFGGAYSNHLIATAAAANENNIKSIGIVRGLHAADNYTQTLSSCANYGMELVFLSKEVYKQKEEQEFLNKLTNEYPNYMIVPEGGANEFGRMGITGLAQFIPEQYTHICVSVGTGTTLAGICNGVRDNQTVMGYVPMKGGSYLDSVISQWTRQQNWQLFDKWHFGGFGKQKKELIAFMNEFYSLNNIPLDMVYSGKMMYGIKEQIESCFFPKGAKVLAVHTGGLQGNSSIVEKLIY